MSKKSFELVSENVPVKSKKTIGKIEVQVSKVKMGTEPPTNCVFTSKKTEMYLCFMRLKSSPKDDAVRMQSGSGETHIFFPDGIEDDLIIEVHDSKRKYCGSAVVQVANIADGSQDEKFRSWIIYNEAEDEQVGKIYLQLNYSTTADENSPKCKPVAETIAYDYVLETAMKAQEFQQRKFILNGSWKWLVSAFESYFGVSDVYTKLRYLSYVMDVATPTADCLNLVHDLLLPVVTKGKEMLSHHELRLFEEVSGKIEKILVLVFENYKSLDESLPSGMVEVFGPATGTAAPALAPAFELYKLLHDILSPEIQLRLCRYFQNAAKKRCRRHLAEIDEFVSSNNENMMDPTVLSTAYKKMKSLCLNIRNEVLTDIEIHKQDILPSFIDLPNLSSPIYGQDFYNGLQSFLVSWPPPGPTAPVVDLVIATANFQKDLLLWGLSYIKAGHNAKELFHDHITLWIQDKRSTLLDLCKPGKTKVPGSPTQNLKTSFIDDIYDRLKETLDEYDVIITQWPEFTFTLENAIADVEMAVVESFEKQYVDILSPLKENTKMFGLKFLAKGNTCPFTVSIELGIFLNSMKRMLDILQPPIEAKLKLWSSLLPETDNGKSEAQVSSGKSLSETTQMIRSKFGNYVNAVIDNLIGNTKLQKVTELKKILKKTAEEMLTEIDLRGRMQPLKELLLSNIKQLHAVLDTPSFVIVCRGFWDRMGQEVLKFLEDREVNRSCYITSDRVGEMFQILDDTFASQMKQLLGNAIQEKDLEPPRSRRDVQLSPERIQCNKKTTTTSI